MNAARKNRWGHRDATMVLVAYRHGLRASELVDLWWDQVDFRTSTLHVRRVKRGTPATHPILGDELRALRRLQRLCGFEIDDEFELGRLPGSGADCIGDPKAG
jgi:integrase